MDELRQFHHRLKISQIKELSKGDFLIIGDSEQDSNSAKWIKNEVRYRQTCKSKSFQAFQTKKNKQTKSLAVKRVPADITDSEFQEFLDLNKINCAKAERLKSQKNGRVLPIFQFEINDPTEAETLISQNLVCNVTGIVYKMEEFRQPISVSQCFDCQTFGKKL